MKNVSLRLVILLVSIGLELLIPSIVMAGTYYVSASSGSDTNAGTSTQPWKTLTKAAATVVAGDTVLVGPGIYTAATANWDSAFTPANSGTAGNPITFRSEPPRLAILAPLAAGIPSWAPKSRSYIVLDGFYSTGRLGMYASHHITIKNCEVINGGIEETDASLNWGIFIHSSNDSLVQNNYVHNMRSSGNNDINSAVIMLGFGASRNIIENNLADGGGRTVYAAFGQKGGNTNNNIWRRNIARNAIVAFFVKGSTDQTLFSNDNSYYENIIYNMSFATFEIYHNAKRYDIYNNTAYNTNQFLYGGYVPDALMGSSNMRLWNNIVANMPRAVYMRDPFPISWPLFIESANFNMFFNSFPIGRWHDGSEFYSSLADWRSNTSFDLNSNVADPLFVNPSAGDFSLRANSPAKGAGRSGEDLGAFPTGGGRVGPTPDLTPPPPPQNLRVF